MQTSRKLDPRMSREIYRGRAFRGSAKGVIPAKVLSW